VALETVPAPDTRHKKAGATCSLKKYPAQFALAAPRTRGVFLLGYTLYMTVLVLDIESGSVAVALVHLPKVGVPKVLAYQREHLPLQPSLKSATIAASLEHTLAASLTYISEVAARLRSHAAAKEFGAIQSAAVFFAAPWGVPDLSAGKASFMPGIREFTKREVQAVFGDIAVSFYTSADALAYGSRALGQHEDTLVAALRGELLELLLLDRSGPQAYSTVPLGSRSILRTLKAHGGLSEHEARSMLALAHHTNDAPYEPLVAAAHHLGDSFADAARLFLPHGSTANIVVVAEHPAGEWFARHLAENRQVTELFSEDSTVEALRQHHIAGLLEPTHVQDPFVLLESLFVGDTGVVY
jgi:hypothetical protein